MKLLNGAELASYIKERQLHQVRALKQAYLTVPKLVIISTTNNKPSQVYEAMKQAYGSDIGVIVEVKKAKEPSALALIQELNIDTLVHGIIVQLPLNDPKLTEEIVSSIDPTKDVDGLGENSIFDAATPTAILWLLAGYNIDLLGKNIVIVGQGRLVGAPLAKLMQSSGLKPKLVDEFTENKEQIISEADILISSVGVPSLIKTGNIKQGAVVVDAGVATDKGSLHGDLEDTVYNRDDLKITPQKGGVGPLTVTALFDNVIKAATLSQKK